MRILVDQNLSTRLVDALDEAGYDAVHVSALGRQTAPDPEILAFCREQHRALITADKRLTKFLAAERAVAPSVVIVRGATRAIDVIHLTLARVDDVARAIANRGEAVFSVAPDEPTRVRLLPLGSFVDG